MLRSRGDHTYVWPPSPTPVSVEVEDKGQHCSFDIPILCGDTRCVYRFRIYEHSAVDAKDSSEEPDNGAEGGDSSTDTVSVEVEAGGDAGNAASESENLLL